MELSIMRHNNRWTVSRVIVAGVAASGLSSGFVLGAEQGGSPPAQFAAAPPAKLEKIPGSDLSKVILTPKAAERISLKMGVVIERPVYRWLLVEGEVEPSAAPLPASTTTPPGTASNPPVGAPVRVRVGAVDDPSHGTEQGTPVLSLQADDDDTDHSADQTTAIIFGTDGRGMIPLQAKLVEAPAEGTVQYYEPLNGGAQFLRPGQKVKVRIAHPDNGKPQNVIPYSALIYSPNGKAWTYTSVGPLAFVRHPIEIAYIEGDQVILKSGPPTGSPVVMVGTAELWGVETKNGK
jgi:hypothetical protein